MLSTGNSDAQLTRSHESELQWTYRVSHIQEAQYFDNPRQYSVSKESTDISGAELISTRNDETLRYHGQVPEVGIQVD